MNRSTGTDQAMPTTGDSYLLGGHDSELGRLQLQSRVWEPSGRRLLAEGIHAPFIFITAFDDAQTRAEASASGCAAYFRKADPGSEVLAAIRRLAS